MVNIDISSGKICKEVDLCETCKGRDECGYYETRVEGSKMKECDVYVG